MDIGLYPLNTTRFLLRADPVAVTAVTEQRHDAFDEVDEYAAFQLEFPDGVVASCQVNHNAAEHSHLSVLGTDGRIELEPLFFPHTDRGFTIERGGHRVHVDPEQANQLTEEFDYFAHCLLTDTEPAPTLLRATALAPATVTDNKYRQLVADMKGGVGWRDLRRTNQRRHADRNVEITDVECVVVEGNFPWNLIRVETDADEYGIGEAFPGPASEYVEFLRPGLVGQNPFDLDRLVEHMTQLLSGLGGTSGYSQAAVSGIEIALFDVVGKLTGLPAYQLLGGKYRDAVRIYADCHAGAALSQAGGAATEEEEEVEATVRADSSGADGSTASDTGETYAPESYAAVARDVLEEGFTAMKFDLDIPPAGGGTGVHSGAGTGGREVDTATRRLSRPAIDHRADVVAAVREAVGSEPTVGFDVHWNYEVDTATALARAMEEYDVSWLEDPVPPDSVDAHRAVSGSTTTPILSGENLTRVEGFLPFLTDRALDIVAPDVQKCGGLQEFRKIATLADAYNVPVAPHNISSPVGTVASVHACSSVPNAFVLEYHAREVDWWDDLLVRDDALIRDGEIAVPESPGLGITLDYDVLEANLAPGESGFDR